jgi:hypothetical protein
MGELKEQWFRDMEIINHCRKNNPNSRFKNWLVKNGHADKRLLEWEPKKDIAEHWRLKYPKTGDGPYKQYTAING